jgi:acetyl esterase/lipase
MRTLKTLVLAASATLAIAASASANALPTSTVSNPIRVPSMGNYGVGTAQMAVTYTDNDATATITAPSVGLGPNQYFRLNSCIKRHALNSAYESKCSESFVDTGGKTATTYAAAPSISMKQARPGSATGQAYFSYALNVSSRQADGSYKQVATSWPLEGIAKAASGIPAQGATTAPAPASEGAMLSGGSTGDMNSGLPDSFCGQSYVNQTSAAASDISTTSLGSGAPAYYEIGEPTGTFAGQTAKGVILVIHGGGWYSVGPGDVAAMRPEADRWRARGWRTLNITYRPCSQSFADVQWFYDRARTLWGPTLPYCATGSSAGGHLALLLAASRATVSCVVSQAGPTDAFTLKSQLTANPSATGASDGPKWTYNLMTAAFGGEDQLNWWSPALWKINARVLWGVAANDWYVPYAQGTELRDKMLGSDPAAYIDVQKLDAGTTPWVHNSVSDAALQSFYAAEDKLVAPLVGA